MKEEYLRQQFKNNSDCYADTWTFDDQNNHIEGILIQSMTEDKFIEILKELKLIRKSYSPDFIVKELEDCEHLDDAIMRFKGQI